MQYRIKVIEYESGRKEYVPQVRRRWWNRWKSLYVTWSSRGGSIPTAFTDYKDVIKAINAHKSDCHSNQIKSVTYKPVEP